MSKVETCLAYDRLGQREGQMNSTRNFVQACASVFILLGAISLVGALAFAAYAGMEGWGFFSIGPALLGIIGAASVVLIGGSTYVVCCIDERLEVISTAATKGDHPSVHPID